MAVSSVFFAAPFADPVSRPTRTPTGESRPSSVLACCSASSSVGAIRAHWQPFWAHFQAPKAATAVLPEPTSPWTRRFIARPEARSAAISSIARRWAPVGEKGSRDRKSSTRPRSSPRPAPCPRRSFSRAMPQVSTSSSSNTSRRRASSRASKSLGKWILR